MIGEFLLDIVFSIVTVILDYFRIGDIVWDVTSEAMAPFMEIVRSICYFFPVGTLASIVGLVVAFSIFRAVIRLITTIWDILPLV